MFEAKRDPSNVRNFLRISYKMIDRKFKIKAWPLKKKKKIASTDMKKLMRISTLKVTARCGEKVDLRSLIFHV